MDPFFHALSESDRRAALKLFLRIEDALEHERRFLGEPSGAKEFSIVAHLVNPDICPEQFSRRFRERLLSFLREENVTDDKGKAALIKWFLIGVADPEAACAENHPLLPRKLLFIMRLAQRATPATIADHARQIAHYADTGPAAKILADIVYGSHDEWREQAYRLFTTRILPLPEIARRAHEKLNKLRGLQSLQP